MNTGHIINPVRNHQRNDARDTSGGSANGGRGSRNIAAKFLIVRHMVAAVALTAAIAGLGVPVRAQTADDLAKQYKAEAMKQALQTKERFALYGLRFETDQAIIQADAQSLLDDIATTLKSFPDWRLRIVGHTDAAGDPQRNEALSLERANAIKAALVTRGIDAQRLATAGAGEQRPVAGNDTAQGRALNRRVELIRYTDSAEARRMLKAMSDYLAAQTAISFDYDATFEVVTNDEQRLALASSGMVAINRPDKIRATRTSGFVNAETIFDGKTLTLLGKDANKYTQVAMPGAIDNLVDELRDKYNRPLPAADLLMSNAYAGLVQDIYDSKDLGSGVINGTECDFVAFRQDEVDLQIWIAQGNRPLPCRYTVTSRQVAGGPQYSIEFRNWKTGSDVVTQDFSFKNSTNAEKIELKDLQDMISEFPANFSTGGKK